jgi:hypothetical protein
MPMTELERARAHLAFCQDDLHYCRGNLPYSRGAYKAAERHFLAALSWVWDAQERASTDIRMGVYQGGMPVGYALSYAPHA